MLFRSLLEALGFVTFVLSRLSSARTLPAFPSPFAVIAVLLDVLVVDVDAFGVDVDALAVDLDALAVSLGAPEVDFDALPVDLDFIAADMEVLVAGLFTASAFVRLTAGTDSDIASALTSGLSSSCRFALVVGAISRRTRTRYCRVRHAA